MREREREKDSRVTALRRPADGSESRGVVWKLKLAI